MGLRVPPPKPSPSPCQTPWCNTVTSFPAKVATEGRIPIDRPHNKCLKDRPKVENGPGVRKTGGGRKKRGSQVTYGGR